MKTVALALQGGGAHGAFVWGVLDRLCQERHLKISAIVGRLPELSTQQSIFTGSPPAARKELAKPWRIFGLMLQSKRCGRVIRSSARLFLAHFAISITTRCRFGLSRSRRSYHRTTYPFSPTRSRSVARAVLKDPERLKHSEPAVFFDLVDVVNGRREIVTQPNITIPSLLASACLPTSSRAIRIGRGLYWEGGYMGNPALAPLVRLARDNEGARDILMVTVNPFRRTDLMPPQSASDIQDRLNEIIFNSSLVLEINGIHTVNNLLRQWTEQPPLRALDNRPLREILFHRISDDDYMRTLGYVSKANPSLLFLEELRDHGRAAAETWLRTSLRHVGRNSSFDVGGLLDEVLSSQLGSPPAGSGGISLSLPEIVPAEGFG